MILMHTDCLLNVLSYALVTMAKNKGQKSKKSVPKKLTGVKKAKTKPVTTNLKKVGICVLKT